MTNKLVTPATFKTTQICLIILCLAYIFTGCATAKTAQTSKLPINTKWLLEDINDNGVIESVQSWLMFYKDQKISGSGGCNHFSGSYTYKDNKIKIGPLASTRMFCGTASQQESIFLGTLANPLNVKTENGLLILQGNGKTLRFSRMK
ncbi:META domain-containing protein [Desulfovibrio sp. UCD-KL4C]|uniref:META domain-containing protein n=1 Tax=Desulfovibrio sp. UCD-KL4C TaxID=2578120 RepID=UPI0025C528D3|nr:META domain-containing protein [Desulfovibrio sp. UCD-KL4C]